MCVVMVMGAADLTAVSICKYETMIGKNPVKDVLFCIWSFYFLADTLFSRLFLLILVKPSSLLPLCGKSESNDPYTDCSHCIQILIQTG